MIPIFDAIVLVAVGLFLLVGIVILLSVPAFRFMSIISVSTAIGLAIGFWLAQFTTLMITSSGIVMLSTMGIILLFNLLFDAGAGWPPGANTYPTYETIWFIGVSVSFAVGLFIGGMTMALYLMAAALAIGAIGEY